MNCKSCPTTETVLTYNAELGKYLLQSSTGNKRQATLVSNSLVHGYSTILASNDAFIASESKPIQPIPKAKLLEELKQDFVPCFIIELEYDIPILDDDTLDSVVPCQSLYYSAGQILTKGISSPTTHFCGKVCARELYQGSTGPIPTTKVTHIASEAYEDCSDIAKPNHLLFSQLNFTGVDQIGRAVFPGIFTEDYPGIEPAVHKVELISAASAEFTYFGICPVGISSYSTITAFVGSRGEIFGGIPSTICVPLCGSASSVYASSHNLSTITQGYSAYPDFLLIGNATYAEWMLGDVLPVDDSNAYPSPPFSYTLPLGQSGFCGFSDPAIGREYYINDYVTETQPIVYPQSTIGLNLVTVDMAGQTVGNVPGPAAYKEAIGALHLAQESPSDSDLSLFGIYTHIVRTAVPSLSNGLISITRLPYRESTALYDNLYKPLRPIKDYIVLIPKTKNPSDWLAYSLIRMKKAETDYLPTFDEASLSLVASELGDRVFAACKYGFYEPEAISTGDQLKTAYADYTYDLSGEGIDNFAQGLKRDETFSPNRRIGNYGYEPYILPGEAIPEDVTDCQDALKHTHTISLDGSAYLLRHDSITDNALLAQALIANSAQDFTLDTYNCAEPGVPLESQPMHIAVSNIGLAIDNYLAFSAPGITSADLIGATIKRIKPIAL